MKPMLGQLQNGAGLDELMNSSKPAVGNFDRAGVKNKSTAPQRDDDSSFSHMLLATLNKSQAHKPAPKQESAPQRPQASELHGSAQNARRAFAEKVANNSQKPDISPRSQQTTLDRSASKPVAIQSTPTQQTKDGPSLASDRSEGQAVDIQATGDNTRKSNLNQVSAPSTKAPMDGTAAVNQTPVTLSGDKTASEVTTAPASVMNGIQLTPEQMAALALATNPAAQGQALASDQIAPMAAAGVTTDAKAILSPLKNLMAGKPATEGLLNRNPVLAFVTGHLEKLEADTLPSLISDSALIKQALASTDIAQFMQTPMSISDLANLLELDQSLINKASQAGLDPSKLVTPKEFLQALGLDSGRIASELTMLKQKLPVEGVTPYVQRAKAMAANASKAVSDSSVATNVNKLGKEASSEIASGKKSASDTKEKLASELNNANVSAPMIQTVDQAGQAQIKNNIAMNMASTVQSAQNNVSGLPAKAFTDMQQMTVSATKIANTKPSMNREMIDPAELLAAQAISSGMGIIAPTINTDVSVGSKDSNFVMPTEIKTESDVSSQFDLSSVKDLGQYEITKDPYSELGRQMDTATTTKIDFGGDGISQRSLEEHLLSNGFSQSVLQNSSTPKEMTLEDLRSGENAAEMIGFDSVKDLATSLPQDVQAVVQPSTESFGANLDFSQGESFQDGSANFRDQASDVTANLSKSMSEVSKSESAFTDKVSDAPKAPSRESLASKILGQAQMMFKNGGGSMRLDMEAPGIGKVDVAINLINNQLDVRIVTASEQARDMISKEVVGLRDGLTQQGISLRGLEVGKAGESSPRNFAGQGQQFGQGAEQQRASYNDMRDYAQSFRNPFAGRAERATSQVAPTLSRWSNATIPGNGNGRLEVRV